MKTLFFALMACVSLNANAALIQFSLSGDEINVGETTSVEVQAILDGSETFDFFWVELFFDNNALEFFNVRSDYESPDDFLDVLDSAVILNGNLDASYGNVSSNLPVTLFSFDIRAIDVGEFLISGDVFELSDLMDGFFDPVYVDVTNVTPASLTVNAVPAPQTAALMLLAVAGVMVSRRKS